MSRLTILMMTKMTVQIAYQVMTTMIGRSKCHKIKNPNIFFTNLHVWIPFIHYDYPPSQSWKMSNLLHGPIIIFIMTIFVIIILPPVCRRAQSMSVELWTRCNHADLAETSSSSFSPISLSYHHQHHRHHHCPIGLPEVHWIGMERRGTLCIWERESDFWTFLLPIL